MDWQQWILLVVAGVGSGLVGYGAGLASLISYPALLLIGLPPVVANVTNTVGVIGTAIGGSVSARAELRPQRHRVALYTAAGAVGGAGGAVLLLTTPTELFERLVPVLVALAAAALLARPWLRSLRRRSVPWRSAGMLVTVAVVSLYGGYFGAAAGIVLLAVFGALLDDTFPALNALKTIALGGANTAAAVVFAFTGLVDWRAALALGIGSVLGSALAPPVVRRVPEPVMRVTVALCGFGLAASLAVDAF